MSQDTELIARLRRASDHIQLTKDQMLIAEAADALQAMERVPMTEQQAAFLYGKACEAWVLAGNDNPFLSYCRAIEAHHGITPTGETRMPWQPIETAPKDGTRVLIKGDCTVIAGWQFIDGAGKHGWAVINDVWIEDHMVKYWQTLPTPPESKG